MSDLFTQSISAIEAEYKRLNYALGWRFLNCSKAVLLSNPDIAFITLNPGGREIPADHPSASCESGNAYQCERWGTSAAGHSPLQIQIQRMFSLLQSKTSGRGELQDYIEASLAGYFVPFRSPRLKDLPRRAEAFDFARNLWSTILRVISPTKFICIDKTTFSHLATMIPNAYGLAMSNARSLPTGWGNYTGDLVFFGKSHQIRLLRLPHLSTFKLFTSAKCKKSVDAIFDLFTGSHCG